jgi:outer membrane protein assembly factor BamB
LAPSLFRDFVRRALLAVALFGVLVSCERKKLPAPPPAGNSRPALQKLQDPDPIVRSDAARGLAQPGHRSNETIAALAKSLQDENAEVRYSAASSLRVLKISDETTARALLAAMLKDPVPKVRAASAKALRDAEKRAVLFFASSLVPGLIDEDPEVRRYTGEMFHALGPEAEQGLALALNDENPRLRDAAARHLLPDPRGTMWGLINGGLQHRNPLVRSSSAAALGRMGWAAWPALKPLQAAIDDPDPYVRRSADAAIRAIDPESKRNIPPPAPEITLKVSIGERFEKFEGVTSSLPGSWPNFRGPGYDNISREDVSLSDRWPATGPPILWTLAVGSGYAGAAVHKGKVYVTDYSLKSGEDSLRCLSLETGKEIWRRSHRLQIVNNHGYSRCVPAVNNEFAVTIGPLGHVLCVDAETGDYNWGIDLVKDYGAVIPPWWSGQCPILDGSTAVLAPCGTDVLLMGVDCDTGKVVWKTPNPHNVRMSHSSVTPMTVDGKRTYVYVGEWGHVCGVSAEPGDAGKLLWKTQAWQAQCAIPSPVVLDGGYLFLTAGYRAGSALVRVVSDNGRFKAEAVWRLDDVEGLSSEVHTPVIYGGHLFSVFPDSAGPRKRQFACMLPRDGGKILWASGKERRFAHYGPVMLADGKFFILDDKGVLSMVNPSLTAFELLDQFQVPGWRDTRGPMALAGGRMILRDVERLICLDLRKSR